MQIQTAPEAGVGRSNSRSTRDGNADRFLHALYDNTQGWACLAYIDGDPRYEKPRQEWFRWPRQHKAMLDRADDLAVRFGNVYVGLCLHTRQQRTIATALPSPWLW